MSIQRVCRRWGRGRGIVGTSDLPQLDRIVRGVRRVRALELAAGDPDLADWRVRTRERYDSDGNLAITITTRARRQPRPPATRASVWAFPRERPRR
ncbi:MAG: hypothetical protein H7323_15645 [Frankiales bacterium]|nr:hypothetical protein [Frankiales bacterium]